MVISLQAVITDYYRDILEFFNPLIREDGTKVLINCLSSAAYLCCCFVQIVWF